MELGIVTARKITAHKSARSGWKPIVARRVALERRFKAQFIADAYDSDSNEGFSDLAGNEGDGGPDMDGDLNAPSQSSISRLVPLTSGPAKRKAKGSGKKAAEKLSTLSSPVKTTTPKEFHVALPIRIPASRAKTAKSSKPPDVAPAVHATTISIRPGLALKSVPEPLKDKSSSSMETPLAPDTLVTSSSRPLPIQVTPSAKHVLPGKVAPCISLLAPSPAMDEVVTRITSEAPIARPASTLPPTPPLSSLFSFSLPSLIPQSPSSTSISSTPPCSSPKQTDDAPSKGPPSEHVIHLPKSPLPSIFGGLYRGHGGDVIIKSRPHVGLTCPSAQGDLSDGVSTVTSSEETQGIGSDVVNDDTGKGGAVVGVRLAIEKVGVRLADDEIRDGELSSVVGLGAEEEAKGSAEGIEMANESRVGERVSLMSAHMDASPGVDWVSSTTDLMKEGGMGGSCEVANGSGVPGVSAKAVDPAMDRGLDTNVSAVNSVVGGVDVVVVSKTKEMEDSPSRKTAASTFGSVHGTTPLSMGGVDVAPSVKWTVSDDIPPVGTAMEEGTTPHVATMQEVGEDDMDVDTERTPDHLGRPDSVETACPDENSGSPMTRDARAKSLHSVQLLRDLLHFLRMPARDRKPGMARNLEEAMENVKSQGLWPSDSYIRDAAVLDGEQSMTVDQRLDILAHASVALANDLYPFRGEELETRINSLDIRLQEQFQMIQNSEDMPFNDYDARSAPIPHRNNGASTSIGLQSEHLERQLEDIGIQTHTESVTSSRSHPPLPNKHRLLSPDATMIDLSTPVTQVAPESSPAPEVATGHRSVAGTVMSMMRNMADLLELSNHGQTEVPASRSVKGKEKAIDFADVDIPEAHWPGKSPVMATLLEEFRHMKEEMRRSQQRSRDELKSIRMAHFTEMETLKDQIRRLEDRGKEEVDKVLHRCQDEMEELKTTIRFREPEGEREKRKAKKNAEESAEPSLELIELRRRVAMLETRARTEVSAADIPRSVSRSSMTNGNISEPAYARNPGSHPLSHLIGNDYEDSPYTPTFKPPRPFARDGSISKPGTPAPSERRSFSIRHPDIMDMDEGIPLPAKSQRKMHMMSFSRPPPG
ncbi:hypothetical protein B0H34DRAFT_277072 [Crassisporium funariophilum]|nr:hypothetical protein B0H34DRAFT_277072 [Crassisporium funariophilum]